MKNVDYIIVGCGLAGIAFCEQLREHKKSFLVFDNASHQASLVASGLYNPVVLRRFTKVWKAREQLEIALPKYKTLENLLNVALNHELPIYRKFSSVEEQNQWFTASDKPSLEAYMSTNIIKNSNPNIIAPFGFGKVLQTGRIDTGKLVKHYHKFLEKNDSLIREPFCHGTLVIADDFIKYKDIVSKYIVFAEGFGMEKNPFFKGLPLSSAKGEIITINAPELKMDFILKSSVFIVPIKDDVYTVGATYNWEDKTNAITKGAKHELVSKLETVITCDFEIVDQVAGIRPTVKDRRPLIGRHPKYNNLFVLNGLGTRGVMMAPFVAEQLYNFIENRVSLNKEMDIKRFNSLLQKG